MKRFAFIVIFCGLVVVSACDDQETNPVLLVESISFGDGNTIAGRHTCNGDNTSPPLYISKIPSDAVSIAVIMSDSDAQLGPITNWLVWGIPVENGQSFIKEAMPNVIEPLEGIFQGTNDTDTIGYSGPCSTDLEDKDGHLFVFGVYALNTTIDLNADSTYEILKAAIDGHIVGYGELTGRFED